MVFYRENPKDATRKLVELNNEYSKVAGYKIKTEKLCMLTMKNQEEKLRKQSHSPLQWKRTEYLEIYLSKMTKDLYTENYKTLMKEIKNDTNRWRDMPCSWKNMSLIGRIDILKMGIQDKAIYRFKEITLEFLVLINILWLYNNFKESWV